MKISRINKMGSFGVYIDDVDMNHMTDDEWAEIGKICIKELVVIFRNINISKIQYADWIPKWGPLKSDQRLNFHKKYGPAYDSFKPETWNILEEQDRIWIEYKPLTHEPTGDGRFLNRIYGRRDADGNSLGYFDHGDVYWHSNESSSLTFTPVVSLLGWDEMKGSATCFVQSVDVYEQASESFRSELDDMILIHKYIPGNIADLELTDEKFSLQARMAFCPVDGAKTPLICTAPNGRKGIRYTVNTCAEIEGMSDDDTQKVFNELDKLVFNKDHIFEHWYQQNNELCIFDQSVTLHKRLGGSEDRLAFRMQFDPSPLLDATWRPWQGHDE